MPFATINSHRIHYVDAESQSPERGSDRPPLIMIHGLGSSQNFYMPVIPLLKEWRCIAFDTYGAGRSKSQGEHLTLLQLAEDILGLMDHLQIQQAILIGHSMGGAMVLTAAALFPQRIKAVVALGPVKPKCSQPDVFEQRIQTVLEFGMEKLADSIPSGATGKNSTTLQKAMIRELILGQDPQSYASHCRVIIDMEPPDGGFARVKSPVLILAGEEDKSAPLAGCEDILGELGSIKKEIVTLSGTGHWHCIEAAELVAQHIDTWASSL